MMKPRFLTLVGMMTTAALMRILPHPWNMTPVAAMALFGGAQFKSRWEAFGVPLCAMIFSDMILGFDSQTPLVYLSFALIVMIGFWVKKDMSVQRIAIGSMASSILFFIVTNFATWTQGAMYPLTTEGLVLCYTAALPFFRNTLFGDLGYTTLLFGSFYLASRAFPVLSDARTA